MNRLTAKQLLMINQKLTKKSYEASDDMMKVLELISKLPYEQDERFFYKYKNTIAKAAKLGSTIAYSKPFKEKNTQTAIVALMSLLELNKAELINYQDDLNELVKFLEAGEVEATIEWIKQHVQEDEISYYTES